LLARRLDGVFVAPFEQGEIGPDLFRAACNMGLEGFVSKRRDRPYQAGRLKHWVKVKNREYLCDEPGDGCIRLSAASITSSYRVTSRANAKMTPTTYSASSDSPLTEHEKGQIAAQKS
jgi:hypothetical protein